MRKIYKILAVLMTATLMLCITQNLQAQSKKKLLLFIEDADQKPVDVVDIEVINLASGEVMYSQTVNVFPESIHLPAGSYSVLARKYGYESKTDTIELYTEEIFHKMVISSNIQRIKVGSGITKPSVLIPGIINIIDREQIEQLGFRDLTELLRNIAGIEFAHDVFGNVGIGMRGVWGMEGKVLFLLNGAQINEINYGSVSWYNRIPLENVQKIEIMRGPVSVLNNGGLASYGTINIVTRTTDDQEGVKLGTILGKDKEEVTRQIATLLINKKFGNDFKLDISAVVGHAHLGFGDFVDFYGDTFNQKNESQYNTAEVYLGATYKNVQLRMVLDDYQVNQKYGFDANLDRAYKIRYPVSWLDLSSVINLSKKLSYIPKVYYTKQRPYGNVTPLDSVDAVTFGGENPFDDITSIKFGMNHRLRYAPSNSFQLELLTEYSQDNFFREYKQFQGFNNYFFSYSNLMGGVTVDYYLLGARKLNSKKAININLAARYDKQTFFEAFTPQVGLTLLNNKFYSKFLVARAFKTPLLSNLIFNAANQVDLKPNIQPEFTNSFEAEFGYAPTIKTNISAIIYQMQTTQTIVYGPGINYQDNYFNGSNTGTKGVDVNGRIGLGKYSSLYLSAGVYSPINLQDTNYKVANVDANLGFSRFKASVSFNMNLESIFGLKRTFLNIGFIRNSPRYYVTDTLYNTASTANKNYLNLNLQFKNIAQQGLDVSFGVYDALNQGYDYPQPYFGGMAKINGLRREFLLRIAYNLSKE